jgi:O-antigen ligase
MSSPQSEPAPEAQSGFGSWMGSMWLYTILRFGLFFALWGLLVLLGVHGILGALVAVALSIPLSYVLLARPRAHFAAQLEQRVNASRVRRSQLDTELDPSHDEDAADNA